jgi:hypothetical protein
VKPEVGFSGFAATWKGSIMGLILLILLVLLLVGGLPRWPHSRNWGYGPSGILGLLLVVLLILLLLSIIPFGF